MLRRVELFRDLAGSQLAQFTDFAARTDPDKLDTIVAKTLVKMSDAAKSAWERFSAGASK